MANLSDLVTFGGNLKTCTLTLTSAAAVNSQSWNGNNSQNKIPFNGINNPFNICTINPATSSFSLPAGLYSVQGFTGGFYAPGWGGSWAGYVGLGVGSTIHTMYKEFYPQNTATDPHLFGPPILFDIDSITDCFLEFRHGRTSGSPWVFQYISAGVDANTYGPNIWFGLNIVKLK